MPFRHLPIVLLIGLALRHAAAAPAPHLAIAHVTVIDGSGAPPKENVTVLVAGDRIDAIIQGTLKVVPRNVHVVDARGKFLIPGLWDMHVHLAKAGANALALFVANGVTSVRDMGGDLDLVQSWRREIDAGARIGPRIATSGPILESATRVERMRKKGTVEPVERFRVSVANPAAADAAVDSLAARGVDFIKVRTVASLEAYRAIAAAARRRNLALAGHGDAVPPEEIVQAGQRSVEHLFYPPLQRREEAERLQLMAALARAQIVVVPTAVNYYDSMTVPNAVAERIARDTTGVYDRRRRYLSGYLIRDWQEQLSERRGPTAWLRRIAVNWMYSSVLRDFQEMHRAGVRLLPGTDVAVVLIYPGFSLHDELRHFVDKLGMTPMAALVSATRHPAEFFSQSDVHGTVAAGKIADLVLLDANPLVDIRNTRTIRGVVLRGRFLYRAALDRLLVEVEAAARRENNRGEQ